MKSVPRRTGKEKYPIDQNRIARTMADIFINRAGADLSTTENDLGLFGFTLAEIALCRPEAKALAAAEFGAIDAEYAGAA